MQTGLEGKPWWASALVGGIIGAIIFGLLYWRISTKQQADLAAKEAHLAGLQAKIQEGRAAKASLPQFREEVRRLELELDKLLRILPARRNTPDLLRRIRALTEQGNFDLLRFTPGVFADRDFYSEWPIAIDVRGTYHNLAMFFDRVGRFSRIINVENLGIGAFRQARSEHTISASFIAKTFIYKEPPPPEPAAPPPAGGGG